MSFARHLMLHIDYYLITLLYLIVSYAVFLNLEYSSLFILQKIIASLIIPPIALVIIAIFIVGIEFDISIYDDILNGKDLDGFQLLRLATW